jgi:hypothetical protein
VSEFDVEPEPSNCPGGGKRLAWDDNCPEEMLLTKAEDERGRCDYCGLSAVLGRVLCLPDMPGIVHDKDEAWKGAPEAGPIHFAFAVEFCAECENRFGARPYRPIPFHLVEFLVDQVAEWETSEFPDEEAE